MGSLIVYYVISRLLGSSLILDKEARSYFYAINTNFDASLLKAYFFYSKTKGIIYTIKKPQIAPSMPITMEGLTVKI